MCCVGKGETGFLQKADRGLFVLRAAGGYVENLNAVLVSMFQKIPGAGNQFVLLQDPLLPGIEVGPCFGMFKIMYLHGRIADDGIVDVENDGQRAKTSFLFR